MVIKSLDPKKNQENDLFKIQLVEKDKLIQQLTVSCINRKNSLTNYQLATFMYMSISFTFFKVENEKLRDSRDKEVTTIASAWYHLGKQYIHERVISD